MSPNMVVRPRQSQVRDRSLSGPDVFFFICLIVCASLVSLFTDREAEKEKRKQRNLFMQQAFFQVLNMVAENFATGLNTFLQYTTLFLQPTGIQVCLPENTVTREGVILVAHWILLLLICYGVVAIAFWLLTFCLRWLWFLLKVAVVLACFGLILNDQNVSTETKALRLVCLGCVCILLSTRPWKDWTMSARIVQLEEQLKHSEKQARELETWKRRVLLSCCLIVLVVFIVYIVFVGYASFLSLKQGELL